jgi:DNA-binding MarR family transcriptional regulator
VLKYLYYSRMNQADGLAETAEHGAGNLVFSLIAAAHAVEGQLEDRLAEHGLSLAKLNVLSTLATASEALTLGEVAARIHCVRSNVTQLVDRLEADGLVRREPDPVDRRSIRAVLTEAGRRLQREGQAALDEAQATVLARVGGADRALVERILGLMQ